MLLICGPTGGGKSTFIQHILDGVLASEILLLLPVGCESWPVVEANDVLKGDLTEKDFCDCLQSHSGAFIHYDIVFIRGYGVEKYEDDPALAALARVENLLVVFVRPKGEVLHKQYVNRKRLKEKSKSKASLFWARFFRSPARRILAPFSGRRKLEMDVLYSNPDWVSECYSRWENYLSRLNAVVITVEPSCSLDGAATFRLINVSDTTSKNEK